MRNFKKFLALVLATMMVLGGMVTVSAAEETAAAESVDYDAIYQASAEDLAALDILKGSIVNNEIDFALQNSVTRWQMALFVARIMTGETNDLYWSKVTDNTTPFDDVTNYFGAISYVSENGIVTGKGWIAGVGDNCFDPNGDIKVEEALTMAVRALGYKQLQYPQGFMTVAEDLGLTDGLEDLAIGTALTRGQMVQILKNMLYVKVDGAASFAQQNFGLKEDVYVVVATNLQYMIGAERVTKNGYVALAKLNADGTYDYSNYIHVTEAELGLEKGEGERKIGYSYIVSSFDNYAGVYSYAPTPTATFQNYGDEKNEIQTVNGYNYVQNDKYVKIDGVMYELVKSYTNLNNKSTSIGNNDGELIVHSYYKGAYDTAFTYYRYDLAGNILDENGNVAIYYNQWLGNYYVILSGSLTNGDAIVRVATDDDFAKYAVAINGDSNDMYGVITDRADLTTIKFSEITMIDDNCDGKYDRAIYIPYSVGKYGRNTDSKTMYTVSTSTTNGSQTDAAPTVNGKNITMVTTNRAGYWVEVNPSKTAVENKVVKAYVRESDINFINNKPKKNEYIVYYYNVYSRDFVVVENLGTAQTGTVTAMTQGTYAYDTTNKTYFYKGATVTVDGNVYGLGYRPYETRSQAFLTKIDEDYTPEYDTDKDAYKATTDLQYIDADLANYGYDQILYSMLVAQNYKKLSYVVLAGRVIYAGDGSTACGWMVFDYGYKTDLKAANGYTSFDYEGDIIGVDEDGNILVKAYADKTGTPIKAKISSINGYNYGLLVEDYAALRYQYSGIGALVTGNMDTMKQIVIMGFFETLTKDLAGTFTDENGNTKDQHQLMYIVTGYDETTGTYEIYTDLDLYWGTTDAYMTYRQPSKLSQTVDITFMNGIATAFVCNGTDNNYNDSLVLDGESVILVAGKDGIRVATGVPESGAQILFHKTDSARPVIAYSLSSDLVFVASKDLLCEQIYTGEFDDATTGNGYNYYMVLGRAKADEYEGLTSAYATFNATTGAWDYIYTGIYDLRTGETTTLTVPGGLKGYNTATGVYGNNIPKPLGAIYAEKNGVYTLLTTNLVDATYIDGTYRNNYRYATDSMEILKDLLCGGYSDTTTGKFYDGIYESAAKMGGKASSHHALVLSGTDSLYDPYITFTYDVIKYTDEGEGKSSTNVDRIWIDQNNRKSHDANNSGAAIYFTHEFGVSFKGTAIAGQGNALNVETNTTLKKAKEKAIAALELADDANPTAAAAALAAGKTAINNALTLDEVTAQKNAALKAIAAAIKAAGETLETNKKNAENALATLKADLAAALLLDADNTTLASVSSWIAQYEKLIADKDYATAMTEIAYASGLVADVVEEINEKAEQEAAGTISFKSLTYNATTGTYTLVMNAIANVKQIYLFDMTNNGADRVVITVKGTGDVEANFVQAEKSIGTVKAGWAAEGTLRTVTFTAPTNAMTGESIKVLDGSDISIRIGAGEKYFNNITVG